ncbi:TonB-dependent receptor domain-containing protein [Nitrospira sp. Nam74]
MPSSHVVCYQIRMIALGTLIYFALPAAVLAQETAIEPTDKMQRKQKLEKQLKSILDELDQLKQADQPTPAAPTASEPVPSEEVTQQPPDEGATPEISLEDMSITSRRLQKHPDGVTLTATPRSEYDSQPTRTMRESLESLPGVVVRQANGPRDFSISLRGSGVKTSFAIRDLKIYEDGISQTQSDGLSRLDMNDPWFMRSVEVLAGASSSLYDNYALGGMVHFKTRRGSDINGVETFLSGGSFGYQKYAFAVGKEYSNLDISMFGSQQLEDGFIRNSNYNTQTINLNFRFRVDDKQNFYFKAITNWLDTRVPTRLTQSQFNNDPRQAGGTGCATTGSCNDAVRLGQGRIDRRTIVGGLYERQLDANTVLTIEADYDVKDINQTFTQITANVNPNYKHYTDLRHDGRLLEMPLRSYVGFFVNNMEQEGQTFTNLDDFHGTRGTLAQNNHGTIRNIGGRIREELEFVPKWTVAAGFGFEQSMLSIQTINYAPSGAVSTRANANRTFYNYAPEMSLTWKPAEGFRHWVRASTGYGIPTFSNLTTGLDGLAGTNFSVKPQKNLNLEIGTDSQVHKTLSLHLVGFLVYFKDEIITQSNSTNTGSFAVNADSSRYRGVEVGYNWRPLPGWRLSGAYTHIDTEYIKFTDQFQLVGGPVTQVARNGKQVPNVPTDVLNMKEEYYHPSGWGGWFESSYWNSYFLNNGNTVGAPAYWLLNVNLNKMVEIKNPYVRFAKFYIQLDNLLDKRYVASGNVVADSTPDASKTLFFAGYGRAIYGGVTLGLF